MTPSPDTATAATGAEPARQPTPPERRPLTARQRILFNQVLDHFLAEGFADFTVDRAARELKCSKSTLYRLGDNREAIIRRILIGFFREVTRRTDAARTHQQTPQAALSAYFTAMGNALEGASPAFMRDAATVPAAREIYAVNTAAATRKVTALIEEGVAGGDFAVEQPAFVADLIRLTLEHIQDGTLNHPEGRAAAYRQLGQTILAGILRR